MASRWMFLVAALGLVAGLANAAEKTAPRRLAEITLTRSGNGDGAGPEDELYLRGNGIALYKGIKNVERLGLYSGDLPSHEFERPLPLLEKMYASLRGRPHSTGKPTAGVVAVQVKVLWDGRWETIEDLCPGLDPELWAFEKAVRGVAADVAWKPVDPQKAWPEPAAPEKPEPEKSGPGSALPGTAGALPKPAGTALELAPSDAAPADSLLKALTSRAWVAEGPIDLLGRGTKQTLRFTRAGGGGLECETDFHRTKGFDDPGNAVDRTEKEPCEIRGPVLWVGGRPQTFVVVGGRLLVLNAVVPVASAEGGANGADGKSEGKAERKVNWYYAARDRDAHGKPVRVEEYRFDFADDPLKQNTGKGSMRSRVGDYPPKTDEMHFTLTKTEARRRFIQIDVDGPNGTAHGARLLLSEEGDYGLMLDSSNLDSRLYTAAPKDAAGKAPHGAPDR